MAAPSVGNELDKGIYDILSADEVLMALVSDVYPEVAREADGDPPEAPYLVWEQIGGDADGAIGLEVEEFEIDFKVIDDADYSAGAEAAMAEVHRLMDDTVLTMTNYANTMFLFQRRRRRQDENGFWVVTETYQVRTNAN